MIYEEKKSNFPYVVISVILILGIVFSITLVILWNSLTEYEIATPKYAIQSVVTLLEEQDYNRLKTLCDIDNGNFFDEKQYVDYMEERLGSAPFEVFETVSTHPNQTAFKIGAKDSEGIVFTLEQQSEGGYIVTHPSILTNEYIITCPGNIEVIVNDKSLSKSQQISEPTIVSGFDDLEDIMEVPMQSTYVVKGFTTEPQITVKDVSVENYEIVTDSKYIREIVQKPTQSEIADLTVLAEDVAKKYSLFVSNDLTLAELEPYIYKDTPLLKRLKEFENEFYDIHKTPEINNFEFVNIEKFSDNHFCVEVKFTFHIVASGAIKDVASHYKMYFVKQADKYSLASMDLF